MFEAGLAMVARPCETPFALTDALADGISSVEAIECARRALLLPAGEKPIGGGEESADEATDEKDIGLEASETDSVKLSGSAVIEAGESSTSRARAAL